MSVHSHSGGTDVAPFAGVRTILVPPDILAVPQRPRPPAPKKPAWRPRPDAGPTDRAGQRSWFSDRLFVESQHAHLRPGLGASVGVHALAIALAFILATQIERALVIRVAQPLAMPAFLVMEPLPDMPSLASRSTSRSPQPRAQSTGSSVAERPPVPLEVPVGIEPETDTESRAEDTGSGVVDGAGDGGASGLVAGSGRDAGASGAASSGPLRIGATLRAPRKIKDVRPVYPQVVLSEQSRGTVIIDLTIGTDGKVRDATILRSIPSLDQAALQAVRQWEYEPTRLNGALVSLIMTVVVNFTIQ